MLDLRDVEERRFAAIQAINATMQLLTETNPQRLLASPGSKEGKNELLDHAKLQTISNRWIDKAGEVLLQSLDLASMVNQDVIHLFKEPRNAIVQTAPQSDGGASRVGYPISAQDDGR